MPSLAGIVEKPLPKPRKSLTNYASARILESLTETLLALDFLEKGFIRNAAGKIFQAWRALTGAILALHYDEISRMLSEKEREWLLEKAVPRIPSTRLKHLSQVVEDAGYTNYSHYTSTALELHDYQYHGPDPDTELSKYRGPGEAAKDIRSLARIILATARHLEPLLRQKKLWGKEHEELLRLLQEKLSKVG